jgi:hypothetical protein
MVEVQPWLEAHDLPAGFERIQVVLSSHAAQLVPVPAI